MLIPKKYHFHLVALVAVAVMIFYPILSKKVEPRMLMEGTIAAEDFLHLIDSGQYEQSWNSASALMRDKIFLEVWNRRIPAMRTKVGTLISRHQTDASISDMAEGAPEGKYLTLVYDSTFSKQSTATETVILALEKDENWRVAGYFLK
ncbi:DUF4019 domain-containing protein [Geopsychrobacter electrodiphilus]|uniref:DUF4019 domain-containing protein n=1 Tax=Geopsychrobacter electrodiphilus TaxID=225196 RepID=UPI0003653C5B|nr:DUF4019 domain-containing protein [Geopsychrobacter electrodiphilus]